MTFSTQTNHMSTYAHVANSTNHPTNHIQLHREEIIENCTEHFLRMKKIQAGRKGEKNLKVVVCD